MPIKINGIFWTVRELSELVDKHYTTIYMALKDNPSVINTDIGILIPNSVAQEYLAQDSTNYIGLREACTFFNVGFLTLKNMVKLGLPVIKVGNMDKILKRHMPIIKEAIDKRKKIKFSMKKQIEAVKEIQQKIKELETQK